LMAVKEIHVGLSNTGAQYALAAVSLKT